MLFVHSPRRASLAVLLLTRPNESTRSDSGEKAVRILSKSIDFFLSGNYGSA